MNKSQFLVREANRQDAKAWSDMLLQLDSEVAYSVFEPGERSTEITKYEKKIIETEKNARSVIFLAFEQGLSKTHVIGFLSLNAQKSKKKDHIATVGIGILKPFYSKGIASQLLKKMVSHSVSTRIERIETNIAVKNTRSLALAIKFGFQFEGRTKGSLKIQNEYEDEYLMALFQKGRSCV